MRTRSFILALSTLGACSALLLAADMYRRLLQQESAAMQTPLNSPAGAALVFGMAHVIAVASLGVLFLASCLALLAERNPPSEATPPRVLMTPDLSASELKAAASSLILFTKIPRAGISKTRLIEKIGAENAAALAAAMLKDLVDQLAGELNPEVHCVLSFDPGGLEDSELALRELLGDVPGALHRFELAAQCGGGLGERLAHAYRETQAKWPGPCALIGSDAMLPVVIIEVALMSAANGRAALLPAADGGYVLLALPRNCPAEVFDEVTWSAPETAAQQTAQLERRGIACEVMAPPFFDVDCEADLLELYKLLEQFPARAPRTLRLLNAMRRGPQL